MIWTLVEGLTPTGESMIFENQFIVAKVARREDAEFIVRVHNNAVELAAGVSALRKSATP